MSKDVWHTTDEAPESYADIVFYVDGYLYFASYQPQYNQYGIFGADKVEKWCYVKELSSYILALETELERTRKALDVARHTIGWINQMIDEHADKQAIKIKCEYALQEITALEQKDEK